MVGDEEEAHARLSEVAKLVADFAEGGEVEARGGFVEQQGAGAVNQSASDEETAGFTGRKFVKPAVGEMPDLEAGHGLGGGGFHGGKDMVVGPDADRAEEGGENELAAGDVAGTLSHEVV